MVTEIPYQVNKARLVEKIAELAREKTIEGISDLRDESDRDGMRIVIELKRGEVPEVVLNNLYKHTPLQTTFGAIMLAIVGGQPRVLTLVQILEHFLDFRRRVHSRIHQRAKQADRSNEQIQKSCKLAMPAPGSPLGLGVVDIMS